MQTSAPRSVGLGRVGVSGTLVCSQPLFIQTPELRGNGAPQLRVEHQAGHPRACVIRLHLLSSPSSCLNSSLSRSPESATVIASLLWFSSVRRPTRHSDGDLSPHPFLSETHTYRALTTCHALFCELGVRGDIGGQREGWVPPR